MKPNELFQKSLSDFARLHQFAPQLKDVRKKDGRELRFDYKGRRMILTETRQNKWVCMDSRESAMHEASTALSALKQFFEIWG